MAGGADVDLANDEMIGALNGAGAVSESKAGTSAGLQVKNGGNFAGSISGFIYLVVNSPGKTLTLSGTNTYTSTTTVFNGTLLVNGSNSGGGFFDAQSGATLAGTGSINPNSAVGIEVRN